MKRRRSDLENSDKVIENLKQQLIEIKIEKIKFQDLLLDYTSLKWNCSRLEEFSHKILSIEEELEKLKNYKKFSNDIIFLCEINNEINALCNKITAKIGAIIQRICDLKNNFIFDSKYLYGFEKIFEENTSKICIYDTETKKSKEVAIGPNKKWTSHSSLAQLPNLELFCCYNGRAHDGICCIIDLKSLTVKRNLPPSPYFWNSSCIYHENCIYMFGGTNYINNIPIAFKFDLLQNKWFKVASTSETITHCSLEIFKNTIIISGKDVSSIFKYDLNIESHSDFYLEDLDLKAYKGIFSAESRLYIFENSNFIYESEIDNDYLWKKIGIFNYQFSMFSFKKFNNGSIFISLAYKAKLGFYQFDLKRKHFKKLKDIKDK